VTLETWREAISACVKPKFVDVNRHSLGVGLAFERHRTG